MANEGPIRGATDWKVLDRFSSVNQSRERCWERGETCEL